MEFIRLFYNPDIGIDRRAPVIVERTMTAIRAAGGLQWISECDRDELVWCKKAFIESYLAWDRLEKGRFLLPEGPTKEAFAAVAAPKSLKDAKLELEKRRQLLTEQAKEITTQTTPAEEVVPIAPDG